MKTSTKTLLIGWDGADWNYLKPLIKQGRMPSLAGMVAHGVTANLASLPPFLSPMLWNSIATGKRPWRHGVHGFTEINEKGRVRPVTSQSRKVPAIWNMLSAEGFSSIVVGWYASHPAETIKGVCVAETFFHKQHRIGPTFMARSVSPSPMGLKLAGLRETADSIDPELLRRLCSIDTREKSENTFLNRLKERVAEMYSIHKTALALMQSESWDFAAIYFHFLDWIMHDFEPFRKPVARNVPRSLAERFGAVADGACILQDQVLGETLRVAGPNARVFLVSDHGYLTGDARLPSSPKVPMGIAANHRPVGIFVATGPGIRKGTEIPVANLLDVTPTILHSMNLPTGEDMDGRALLDIFDDTGIPEKIPTWDKVADFNNRLNEQLSDMEDHALLERMSDLGYFEPGSLNNPETARNHRIINSWNLGMDLLDAGNARRALQFLEEAAWANPELENYAFWLGICQARLGLCEQASETGQVLLDHGLENTTARTLLGLIALEMGKPTEALAHFEFAAEKVNTSLQLNVHRVDALLALGRWEEAVRLLESEIKRDPVADVWRRMAYCNIQLGHFSAAIRAANNAIKLNPRLARAHLLMAEGLLRSGKMEGAWRYLLEAHRLDANCSQTIEFARNHFRNRLKRFRIPKKRVTFVTSDSLIAKSQARRVRWDAKMNFRRKGVSPLAMIPIPPKANSSGKTFVIVSGLPRSGTSLMMQMLKRGGLKPLTDSRRGPNEHNPNGFLEWSRIKMLPNNPKLIERAEGKALKIVGPLLQYLPIRHSYKIIATTRSPDEIARSQEKMLEKTVSPKITADQLGEYQEAWLKAIKRAPNFKVLEVSFALAISRPDEVASQVAEFIGAALLPHPDRMAGAVDTTLYRNRVPARVAAKA